MASNKHTGLNPLGIPRIDFTKEGINSGFALLSREVAKRTPLESQTEGSIHLPGGVFNVPPTPIEAPRMRPAFNVVMFVKDGKTKAHFQAAFVIDQANIVPIFDDPLDQTLTVAIGDVFYTKIITNVVNLVTSATFGKESDPVDVEPSEEVDGETYIKCVEFENGDIAGTFKPVYYRFDSIIFTEPTGPVLDYTIFFTGGDELSITEAEALAGYNPGINKNWSLEFELSGTGELTGEFVGVDETERFPDDGEEPPVQTAYRLPIIRGGLINDDDELVTGKRVSSGGLYQEDTACNDGSPVTQLIKVG